VIPKSKCILQLLPNGGFFYLRNKLVTPSVSGSTRSFSYNSWLCESFTSGMLLLSQRPCYDKLIACDTSPDQDGHKASTKLVNIKGNATMLL